MALVTNTTTTYAVVGNREDLQNVIYNISPTDTPFMSMVGRSKAKAVKHEWQTDALAAAAANAQLEGDDYSFSAITPTVRVNNYTQIARKTFLVSGTQDAVDSAGRATETKLQLMKTGRELKLDMERALLLNAASVAGAAGTARVSGGFAAWLTSNVSRGSSGANGGFSSGLVTAATNGTTRAFAEAQVTSVLQSCATNGGKPTMLLMSAANMTAFQSFAQKATSYRQVGTSGKIIAGGNVGVYASPFGDLSAMWSPVISYDAALTRNVYAIDKSMASVAYLRPMFRDKPAKTGDAEKNAMVVEFTLVVKNQAAHGIIADLS